MAGSNGSLSVSVFLAVILWFVVLIVLPAAYMFMGPDEMWRIWEDFRLRLPGGI